jgi:hypothetical protein
MLLTVWIFFQTASRVCLPFLRNFRNIFIRDNHATFYGVGKNIRICFVQKKLFSSPLFTFHLF